MHSAVGHPLCASVSDSVSDMLSVEKTSLKAANASQIVSNSANTTEVFTMLLMHSCLYLYLPSYMASLPPPRSTGTKLCCLVTEAHVYERLAQGCYLKAERPGLKLTTFCIASPASQPLHHQATKHADKTTLCVCLVSDCVQLHYRNHTITALITPVSDVAAALRVNHEKTETALVQVKYYYYDKLKDTSFG